MSKRYATVENIQADGADESGTGGQRLAFKKGESERGVSNPARLSNLFPKSNISLEGYNPEEKYEDEVDGVAVRGNPDFIEGVNLNYKTAEESELLKETANLSDLNMTVGDKPQFGAPNITTPDVNDPLADRERTSSVERKEAGFGTREIEGENVNSPKLTRERIGKYFTEHSRRSPRGFGTSKPVLD